MKKFLYLTLFILHFMCHITVLLVLFFGIFAFPGVVWKVICFLLMPPVFASMVLLGDKIMDETLDL